MNIFGNSTLLKRLLQLAFPMSLSQLINVSSGFLCMSMLATLGHEVLAASSLFFALQTTFIVIGISFLFSISVLVGYDWEKQDYSRIAQIMQQGWLIALLISISLILLFLNIEPLLLYFGQKKELADKVQAFFKGYAIATPFLMLFVANQQLCYGIHQQKIAVLNSLVGVVVLLITAWILILGKFGILSLGTAGLGYAIACQYIFACMFSFLLLYCHPAFKKLSLFSFKNWQGHHFKHMLAVSWPISLQIITEMPSFSLNAIMMGRMGVFALAASQVVTQYVFLLLIPLFSLAQALGILISQARGRGAFHEVKQLGYIGIVTGFILSSLFGTLFLIFPKTLANFYFDVQSPANAETLSLTIGLFAIAAFSQLFDALRNIVTGALRGLLDTRFPMLVAMGTIWGVGLPLSYLLGFTFHYGAFGIPIGTACGFLVGMSLLLYRFHQLTKNYQ